MEYTNRQQHNPDLSKSFHYSPIPWRLWLHHYRTRKQLHALLLCDPEHLHYDLGLSTQAVLAEINKPFWRR